MCLLFERFGETSSSIEKLTVTVNIHRFAAHTLASQSLVLVTIRFIEAEQQLEVCVNCEKMVIGSILLNELKSHLK